MFRNVWDALKKNPLLDDSFDIMDKLHHQTQEMFLISISSLVEEDVDPEEIIRKDKEVNRNVQRVRRKVFEYFSMTTTPNIHSGLILISLVIDYERIGDYAKDIALLRDEYSFTKPFSHDIKDKLHSMKDSISVMFLESHNCLTKMEQSYPTKVTLLEKDLKEKYDELKDRLMDKELARKEVVTALITARIMKRVAGHLDNIATSGTRPFPKLGFKPGASTWED